MKTIEQQVVAQRDYYTATATSYEAMHRDQDHEHAFSLAFLLGMLDHYGAKSVLDVGAGTGNAIRCMAAAKPDVHVVGV